MICEKMGRYNSLETIVGCSMNKDKATIKLPKTSPEEVIPDYLAMAHSNSGGIPLSGLDEIRQSISDEIGIPITVDPNANSALGLFTDSGVTSKIVDSINEYGVNRDYLNQIRFAELSGGTMGGYQPESHILFFSKSTTPEFIMGGGFDHELAHVKLLQEFGNPEEKVSFVPKPFRWAVTDSYEEVAAHKLAYLHVPDKPAYIEMVKEIYQIRNPTEIRDFIISQLSTDTVPIDAREYRRIDKIAEVLALFKEFDRCTYQEIKQVLNEQRLNGYEREAIAQLETTYQSIDTSSGTRYTEGLKTASRILLRGWNV